MPAPGYTIRPGTPSDGAALMRVHRASILALGRNAYSSEETESRAAGLVPDGSGHAMTEGGEIFLLADAAGGADHRVLLLQSR